MCISSPKVPEQPAIPERQAVKLPEQAQSEGALNDRMRRRRGMYATILTSGAATRPSVSGASTLG